MAENSQGVINALKQSQVEGAKVIGSELKSAVEPFTGALLAPLKQMQAGIASLPGVAITKKLFTAVSTPLKNSFAADKSNASADAEIEARKVRNDEEQRALFEDIRDGIFGIQEGLLKGLSGLKDKGLMGLGILAGLIAAPFAALVAFFTQLGIEVKALGKIVGITGDKIKGIFKPIGDIFTKIKNSKFVTSIDDLIAGLRKSISTKFTNLGTSIKNSKFITSIDDLLAGAKQAITGKFTNLGTALKNSKIFGVIDDLIFPIKRFGEALSTKFTTIATKGDDVIKVVGGVGDKIAAASKVTGGILKKFTIIDTIADTVKGLINPIKNGLGAIKTGADTLKPFMAGFEPIMKFAKTIGSTLGKIFLPITILMSAFDFVTGFMDGYDEGGVLGGLEGGISKLFQGLIGMPLDLLKSGVGYILGFFGFDKAKAALDNFSFSKLIDDLVGSIFAGLKGVFGFLTNLFDFSDLTIFSVFEKLIDIVFLPLNLAINFLKDIFGFGDPDKPFSLGEFVSQTIGDIIKFFTDIFNIDVSAITNFVKGLIPDSLLSFFGFGGEEEEGKGKMSADQIRAEMAAAQDRINKFDKGENAYSGIDTRAKRDADVALMTELNKELLAMQNKGGGTTINNYNNVDASQRSETKQIQSTNITDPAAMAGAAITS